MLILISLQFAKTSFLFLFFLAESAKNLAQTGIYVTSGAGTAYLSGAHEFSPVFSWIRVTGSLIFCVMFCRSLFVLLYFYFCVFCSSSVGHIFSQLMRSPEYSNLQYALACAIKWSNNQPCLYESELLTLPSIPSNCHHCHFFCLPCFVIFAFN
jgi:hypothetical protein